MDLDWEKLFKRYVWHDERTPYLTRVANLTRVQARYEIFGYCLFMGVLSGVLAVVTLSPTLPHGGTAFVPVYAFTVCCAALILGFTRHPWAAIWCALAPLAALLYFAAWGFHPGLEFGDQALLVVVALGGLLYSRRLVAVVRAWHGRMDP
ncbi:MAG TPA: hypothetical protein VJ789_01370 [Burkholderiales bacterium]|nr:hypothetical protein [Burkholderiales bacterium]